MNFVFFFFFLLLFASKAKHANKVGQERKNESIDDKSKRIRFRSKPIYSKNRGSEYMYIYIYIYVYSSSHFFFQLTNLSTSYHATKEGRTNESWIIPRMNRQPRHRSIPDKRSLFFFFFFFYV